MVDVLGGLIGGSCAFRDGGPLATFRRPQAISTGIRDAYDSTASAAAAGDVLHGRSARPARSERCRVEKPYYVRVPGAWTAPPVQHRPGFAERGDSLNFHRCQPIYSCRTGALANAPFPSNRSTTRCRRFGHRVLIRLTAREWVRLGGSDLVPRYGSPSSCNGLACPFSNAWMTPNVPERN